MDITRLSYGMKMAAERKDTTGFLNILTMMLGCSQSLADDLLHDNSGIQNILFTFVHHPLESMEVALPHSGRAL